MTFNMLNNAIDIHEYDAHDVMSQYKVEFCEWCMPFHFLLKKKVKCVIFYTLQISVITAL